MILAKLLNLSKIQFAEKNGTEKNGTLILTISIVVWIKLVTVIV